MLPLAASRAVGGFWSFWVKEDVLKQPVNHRELYKKVHNKYEYWLQKRGANSKPPSQDCTSSADKVDAFLKITAAPDWLQTWWCSAYSVCSKEGAGHNKPRALTHLLTWNGPWAARIAEVDAKVAINTLAATLKGHPVVRGLWGAFVCMMETAARKLRLEDWSGSLEISPEDWEKQILRLHFHGFLKGSGKLELSRQVLIEHLQYETSLPVPSPTVLGVRHRMSGNWAGMYYVLCPKIGSVFSVGTKAPHKQFPVNPAWIMTMAAAGKFDIDDARSESAKIPSGISRRLADLDRWEQERSDRDLRQHIEDRVRLLDSTKQPWRTLPEVDTWKVNFYDTVVSRKKVLVLEGGTGLGKTEFVRRLFYPKETFEINARGTAHFSLREFDPRRHACVLFDEAPAELVLNNRKLFQCPAVLVELGASPTAQHVYKVWLNDSVIVVCSNDWSTELLRLATADAAWLRGNTVHVAVSAPLWCA